VVTASKVQIAQSIQDPIEIPESPIKFTETMNLSSKEEMKRLTLTEEKRDEQIPQSSD
jgi:hypothetical protein